MIMNHRKGEARGGELQQFQYIVKYGAKDGVKKGKGESTRPSAASSLSMVTFWLDGSIPNV